MRRTEGEAIGGAGSRSISDPVLAVATRAPLTVRIAIGSLILYRPLPVLEAIALPMPLALEFGTIRGWLRRLGTPEFRIPVSQGPASLGALAKFLGGRRVEG